MSEKKQFQSIKVFVRPMPLMQRDDKLKVSKVVRHTEARELVIKNGSTDKKYNFDHVFNENASQIEVYETAVAPFITSVSEGYTCTIFAYGQSGTGKTHTIFGQHEVDFDCDFENDTSIGLILRAAPHLFSELGKLSARTEYTVRFSFIEIVNEEVHDLLDDSSSLRVYDDPLKKGSICLKNMSKCTVFNVHDVNDCIIAGKNSLAKNSNGGGSRSHLIITFTVDIRERFSNGTECIKTGRLNFVELAGSQNVSRSTQQRTKDFALMNKSLITFGNVIRALEQKLQYVPYRESKLTRILQDSIGGHAKTCLIATFSSSSLHVDETINTLEFARLAKSVVNCPQINVCRKQTDLSRELQDEVERLRKLVTAARESQGFYVTTEYYDKMTQEEKDNDAKLIKLLRQIRELEEHKKTLQIQNEHKNESFLKTKLFVEDAKEQLKAKQHETQQSESRLNALTARNEQMIRNASRILDLCEKRLKEEAIYYRKYQEKCKANKTNTNVAKEISQTTSSGAKDIQQATHTYVNQQQNRFKYEAEQKPTDTQPIKDLACTIETFKPLDVQQIIENESDNVAGIINKVHNNTTEKFKIQDELKTALDEEKKRVVQVNEEIKQKAEKSTAEIARLQRVAGGNFEPVLNFLNEKLRTLDAREAEIKSQSRKTQAVVDFATNELASAKAKKKMLQEEASKLEEGMKFIKAELANKKDTNEFVLKQQLMCTHDETQRFLNDFTIEHVTEQFSNKQKEFESDASSLQQMVDERADKLLQSLKSYLPEYNNHVKETCSKVETAGEAVKTSVLEKSYSDSVSLEEKLTAAKEESDDYVSKTKNIIEKTLSKLESYGKEICLTGHVGDTPVKTSYTHFDLEDTENVAPPKQNLFQNRDDPLN